MIGSLAVGGIVAQLRSSFNWNKEIAMNNENKMATHTFSNRICCDTLTDYFFPTSGYKLGTKQIHEISYATESAQSTTGLHWIIERISLPLEQQQYEPKGS